MHYKNVHIDDVKAANTPSTFQPPLPEMKAARLYETYCASVGGVAFNGEPLPDWQTFRADPKKQKQSDAWIAVAAMA